MFQIHKLCVLKLRDHFQMLDPSQGFLIKISASHLVGGRREGGWVGCFSSIPLISHYPQHLSRSPSPLPVSPVPTLRAALISHRAHPGGPTPRGKSGTIKNLGARAQTWLMNFNASRWQKQVGRRSDSTGFCFFFLFPPLHPSEGESEGVDDVRAPQGRPASQNGQRLPRRTAVYRTGLDLSRRRGGRPRSISRLGSG